jgi:hypothetical protein
MFSRRCSDVLFLQRRTVLDLFKSCSDNESSTVQYILWFVFTFFRFSAKGVPDLSAPKLLPSPLNNIAMVVQASITAVSITEGWDLHVFLSPSQFFLGLLDAATCFISFVTCSDCGIDKLLVSL